MSNSDWQKSSFSGNVENCVEVRRADGLLQLRESDDGETILHTTPATLATLLQGVKAGEFDHLI